MKKRRVLEASKKHSCELVMIEMLLESALVVIPRTASKENLCAATIIQTAKNSLYKQRVLFVRQFEKSRPRKTAKKSD
jgi:hypothetical protein